MVIRWIAENGVAQLSAAQLVEFADRDECAVWAHLDHTDEQGMAALIAMIKPGRCAGYGQSYPGGPEAAYVQPAALAVTQRRRPRWLCVRRSLGRCYCQ